MTVVYFNNFPQAIAGITESEFLGDPACSASFQQTVADTVGESVSPSDVVIESVNDIGTRRRRLLLAAVAGPAIEVNFTLGLVTSAYPSANAAFQGVTNSLVSSVNSGAFQSTLLAYAATNGATELLNATVTAIDVQNKVLAKNIRGIFLRCFFFFLQIKSQR